jgi:pseudouridine kinase
LGRLGVPVKLLSVVGIDADGDRVLAAAAADGVDVGGVTRTPAAETATYVAVLDPSGELAVGLVADAIYDTADAGWAASALRTAAGPDAAVIDANLPAAVIARLLEGLGSGVLVVADPVSVPKAARLRDGFGRLDVVFAGIEEAAVLTGSAGDATFQAAALRDVGIETAVVSMGSAGVVVADAGGVRVYEAIHPERVVDVTGAGDALVAGFVFGAVSAAAPAPIAWGMAAASLAVESAATVPDGLSVDRLRARARAVRMGGTGS